MSLRTCQIDALTSCNENDKGIIRMCCGSGKTMVEIELCLQENISCLVAPRNALLKQHITEFKKKVNYKDTGNEFKYSFSTETFELFTINCEADYEKYDVKGKSSKKVCFIINNCSLTKLPVTPDILIVDEAHTHKMAVFKCKTLKNVKRKYFFTATPQDMTDVDFYGPVINTYDYLQALTENYVTKFKIVPIWKKENFHVELQEKMDTRNLTHCIHFYQTVKENESHNLSLSDVPINFLKNGQKITNLTKNRDTIFKNFKQKGGHLLSCQTISYGIDIPECDSVFLSYIGTSIPDTVQKMMRAIRLNNAKKDKIAYIFVLMDIPEPEQEFDLDGVDITSTVKELQQQLIFKISGILKEGLDLDVLRDYHPYNIKRTINKLKEEKEELLEELENESEESENESESESELDNGESDSASESNENKTQIKDYVREIDEEIEKLEEDYLVHEETIKKSSFSDFFDDYQLQTWYVNGEIKSKISYNEEQWANNFEKLKKLNGKAPSQHSKKTIEEKMLGRWCVTQRTAYRNDKISDKRINQLESLPEWFWKKDLDEIWQKSFEKLIKVNGRMPSEITVLGRWCLFQRHRYKIQKLAQDKIKLLESLTEWNWEQDLDEQWEIKFEELKKLNGKAQTQKTKDKKEKSLANWCCKQKINYKKNKLSEERINLLESLTEWKWDQLDNLWYTKFEQLKVLNGKPSKNKQLGVWCQNQRADYKKDRLSEERIKMLETLEEWIWDYQDQWQNNFDELNKTNGKIPSPKENKTINQWCSDQKTSYKKEKLSEERINLLESLPEWEWVSGVPIKTTVKPKNQTTEETLTQKYKQLSQEELLALLIKKDLQEKSGYQAPNPVSKEQINTLFSENINKKIEGDIIVLDDIQFNSSKAVKNIVKKVKEIIVPNNSKQNEEMSNEPTFGGCVKKCSLQELLDVFISNQKPIKAIYADLMGSLSTEISVLNQIKKCNLTKDCVVGFTVSARSNTGADYTNEYATKLLNVMYKTFNNGENLIDNSGVYVYGDKTRMATCVFKKNM